MNVSHEAPGNPAFLPPGLSGRSGDKSYAGDLSLDASGIASSSVQGTAKEKSGMGMEVGVGEESGVLETVQLAEEREVTDIETLVIKGGSGA